MPTITISTGPTSPEKKEQLVKKITKEAAEVMEIPKNHFTVFIQEHPIENIGVGGLLLEDFIKSM